MKNHQSAHQILVEATRIVCVRNDVKRKIAELKKPNNEVQKDDYVWHRLLCCFSTWGSSKGYKGLIKNPDNYRLVTYKALSKLESRSQRRSRLQTVLQKAGVRYPRKKAAYLAENFDMIKAMGGVIQAKESLAKLRKEQELLKFFDDFKGIGPKYARNVFMDTYHPKFRQYIALDSRIKKVSKELRLTFKRYDEFEAFYQGVARDLRIDTWTLDRMIYWFTDDFIWEIQKQSKR